MKYASIAFTLALFLSIPAQATPRHHHHAKHLNPMVQGIGIGLAHMLKDLSPRYSGPTGPASAPAYGPTYETKAKPGALPDVVDVPPRGWPSRHVPIRVRHRIKPILDDTEHRSGIITVQTAVGIPIRVAAHLAGRFQSLIADLAAHGYRPRHIGCFAAHGHVPGSRHHVGAACDFDQRGWGRTAGFMYHAHHIITAHGFRDGCDFRDCGHVDDGLPLGRRYAYRHRSRYASR